MRVYNGGCRDKNEIDCELLIGPLSVEMRRKGEKRGESERPTAQWETNLLFLSHKESLHREIIPFFLNFWSHLSFPDLSLSISISHSSNYKDASSATVGKVRDLASFRRHFRMGFMTMPASQDLSPHSCAAAMAPRSQSCHAVGTGEGEELENGYYPDSDPQNQSNPSRCPPAKPKRHPNTRLSSTAQQEHPSRGVHAPPDTPPPPPPNHPPKHPEKRNGKWANQFYIHVKIRDAIQKWFLTWNDSHKLPELGCLGYQ